MPEALDPKAQTEILTRLSQHAQRELTPVLMNSCVRLMRRTTEAKDFKAEATGTLFSIQ